MLDSVNYGGKWLSMEAFHTNPTENLYAESGDHPLDL